LTSYRLFSCTEITELLENQKGERILMKRVPLFANLTLLKL